MTGLETVTGQPTQDESILAEVTSLEPLTVKTLNPLGKPNSEDYRSGCAYAGCTGEINGCACMKYDNEKYLEAESNRTEYRVVEGNDEEWLKEFTKRYKNTEWATTALFELSQTDFKNGFTAHQQTHPFSLDQIEAALNYGFWHSNAQKGIPTKETLQEFISKLHPKIGDKVSIKPINDSEAVIVK